MDDKWKMVTIVLIINVKQTFAKNYKILLFLYFSKIEKNVS